jgi:prevent-host-death family protein
MLLRPQTSPHRIVPVTEFRRHATRWTEWVRHEGGRVWITKHGRTVCAVVPLDQLELLETWENRSLEAERARLELAYARWKAVKARESWRPRDPDWEGVPWPWPDDAVAME